MSAVRRSKTARLEAEVGKNITESIGARRAPIPKVVAPPEPPAPREWVRADDKTFRIPLGRIDPDPDQPRKEFPEASLRELAESLKQSGQLQACIVRPGTEKGRYVLVMGERRYRSAKLAELPDLLCRVEAGRNRAELLADQLVENIAREDLSPMDLARALATLRDAHQWTQAMIAHRVGLTQSAVSKALELLDLPKPVQELVEAEKLPASTAREVAKVGTVKEQVALARKAIDESLTRDQVAAEVRGKTIPREYPEPSQGFAGDGRIKGGKYTLAQLNLDPMEIPAHHAIVGPLTNAKKRASVREVTWIKGHAYVYTGGTHDDGKRTEAFFHPIMRREDWKQPLRIWAKNPPGIEKMTGVEVMHRGELWVLGSGKDGLVVGLKIGPGASLARSAAPRPEAAKSDAEVLLTLGGTVALKRYDDPNDVVRYSGNVETDDGDFARSVDLGGAWCVEVRHAGERFDLATMRDQLFLAFTAIDRAAGEAAKKAAGTGVAR